VHAVKIASLHIHPLKGARAIDVASFALGLAGAENDRRFMLAGDDGVFLSQRRHPRLALVETAIEGDAMVIGVAGQRVRVPLAVDPGGPRRKVQIWKDEVDALLASGDASALLSDFLATPCTLVHVPPSALRQVDLQYAREGDRVGFADGYPVLVASLASLADLNARLATPLPMNRFRPSIVLDSGEPFEEERHPRLRVGAVTLRLVKRCARCTVTTVDQATAAVGKEPLRTLATYREHDNEVFFAMNAIPDGEGVLHVGDEATYLD